MEMLNQKPGLFSERSRLRCTALKRQVSRPQIEMQTECTIISDRSDVLFKSVPLNAIKLFIGKKSVL